MRIYENIYDYFPNGSDKKGLVTDEFYIAKFSDFYKYINDSEDEFHNLHRRNFFEITLVIKDSVKVLIGQESYVNTQNALEFVSPYQPFSIENLIDVNSVTDDDVYTIFFKPSFMPSPMRSFEIQNLFPYFKLHSSPKYQLSESQMKEFIQLFDIIYNEAYSGMKYSRQIVQSYLMSLLYKIKQSIDVDSKFMSASRSDLITSEFENILSLETSTFKSLKQYAGMLNISQVYLNECVKNSTQKTSLQVLNDYRILTAKSLIMKSDISFSEISDCLGFSEPTNFTKFFKKHTGLTPKQFKNNI